MSGAGDRIILRDLRASDAPAVAALHRHEITGPLTDLGPAFAEAFYRSALGKGLIRGWGLEQGGTLLGFVVGCLDAHRLFARTLLGNPGPLLLRFGARLRQGLEPLALAFRFVRGAGPDFRGPEISFLAVAPEGQRQGAGRRLVERWESFLAERGISRYELSVDASNTKALGFYQGLGFSVCDRFREYGRERLRLRKTLFDPGAATLR